MYCLEAYTMTYFQVCPVQCTSKHSYRTSYQGRGVSPLSLLFCDVGLTYARCWSWTSGPYPCYKRQYILELIVQSYILRTHRHKKHNKKHNKAQHAIQFTRARTGYIRSLSGTGGVGGGGLLVYEVCPRCSPVRAVATLSVLLRTAVRVLSIVLAADALFSISTTRTYKHSHQVSIPDTW